MPQPQDDNKRYVLNAALQIDPVPEAAGRMAYCYIPSQGQGSVRFAAPDELVTLLREFDGVKTVDEVAAHAISPTAAKFRRLVDTFLIPKGVLLDPGSPLQQPLHTQSKSLGLKRTLLTSQAVTRCAAPLSALLRMPLAAIVLTVILATQFAFYVLSPHAFSLDLARISGTQLTLAILVSLFSALFHEFGHAAGLLRYGGTRTEIGLGLYVYFPVFYTDVSEAWRFSKWQRVVVDVAGIYFQSIVSTVAIWIFAYTHEPTWAYVSTVVNLVIFTAFNPFLKMDGYWLAADLFGVWNLRDASWRAIANLLPRSGEREGGRTQLSGVSGVMLLSYAILSGAFFLYLLVVIGRQVLFVLLPGYPILLAHSVHLFTGFTNVSTLLNGLIEWFWKTSMLAGVFIFAWTTSYSVLSYFTRRVHRKSRWQQVSLTSAGWFVLAALASPIAIVGHEIAHLLAGSLVEVHGLSLQSQSVSFPQEKEFWRLLGLQQWNAASALLSLWRAVVYTSAGPIFSCALAALSALLVQGGRSLEMLAPFLIGAALVSCLRLAAPAGYLVQHGISWAAHPASGLGSGSDEGRLWLLTGIPVFPQLVIEVLVCGIAMVILVRWMRQTRHNMLGIVAVLGALAGTAVYLNFQ